MASLSFELFRLKILSETFFFLFTVHIQLISKFYQFYLSCPFPRAKVALLKNTVTGGRKIKEI